MRFETVWMVLNKQLPYLFYDIKKVGCPGRILLLMLLIHMI